MADGRLEQWRYRWMQVAGQSPACQVPEAVTVSGPPDSTRWQSGGLRELWEAPGRGGQQRWSEADIEAAEQWLGEERTYTSRQLCEKLVVER